MSYAVFHDWRRKEWYKNCSSILFNLSHMTNSRVCVAVYARKSDWMSDAINCNGNFEAGFMRCLHARNDAFFIFISIILWLSFYLKFLFKTKLKRSLYAKFCWKFTKNSQSYLYICVCPLKGSKWMTKLWKSMASVWLVLHKILLQLFLETPKGKSGEYFTRK